jgi:hypothetical protein
VSSLIEQSKNFDVVCLFGFPKEVALELGEKTAVFFHQGRGISIGNEVYYDGQSCDLFHFQGICKEEVFRSFCYIAHPELLGEELERALYFMELCKQVQWQCHLSASDYQDFGLKVFENICQVDETSFDSKFFQGLKGGLKGIPAIICGAGPSLEEDLKALEKSARYSVIFTGGAALGILTEKKIPVHIAAGIDPDPSYERALMQGSFEAPFFYQSRFSAPLLQSAQGRSIRVPSNPSYELEKWLNNGFVFDGGWTVSTFCAALAAYLGCSPIIFAGVDLSFPPGGAIYAASHGEVYPEGVIEWQDLLTKKDWILAGRWLEELMKSYPSTRFYNSSKGLNLEGAEKTSLAYLLEEELTVPYDITGLVHMLCFGAPFFKGERKLDLLEGSIKRSFGYVEALIALFEKHYPKDPREKGEFALNQLDLEDELAYKKILVPLWEVWRAPMGRSFPDDYARDLNQFLFFKKILLEYGVQLCKRKPMK